MDDFLHKEKVNMEKVLYYRVEHKFNDNYVVIKK